MKKVLLAAAMVMALAGAAFAGGYTSGTVGQTKATLNVTAQVINACEVTTTPVNLVSSDATAAPSTDLSAVGSVDVSCTDAGQTVNVSLDRGQQQYVLQHLAPATPTARAELSDTLQTA